MDSQQFDTLIKSLSTSGTRRALVRLLTTLPLTAALMAVMDPESEARRRHDRKKGKRSDRKKGKPSQQRSQRGKPDVSSQGKGKGGKCTKDGQCTSQKCSAKRGDNHPGRCLPAETNGRCRLDVDCHQALRCQKVPETGPNGFGLCQAGPAIAQSPPPAGCSPQSVAQTCTGRCASVTNNCGQTIDCGPCTCGVCPTCNICDAATGSCQANRSFLGQDCGLPGQVCQADGACACSDSSCASGQRCNGIVCVCNATSCPNGCCDGTRTCHRDDDAACGTNGGICTPCGTGTTCCNGNCVPNCTAAKALNRSTCQCECPSGQTDCGGQCVNLQTDPQHCGTCATDCAALPHVASATCAASTCSLTCASGWANCTTSSSAGCETQLGTITDCHECGDTCLGGASCQSGTCQCPSGTTVCNDQCVTDCTAGKTLNPTTCQCNDCPLGQTECSGQCVNLQTDVGHCGSCPNACAQNEICQNGACNFCVSGGCLRTCSGPTSCVGRSGGCASGGCIGTASGHLVCYTSMIIGSDCSTDAECGGGGYVCATDVGPASDTCDPYRNRCVHA